MSLYANRGIEAAASQLVIAEWLYNFILIIAFHTVSNTNNGRRNDFRGGHSDFQQIFKWNSFTPMELRLYNLCPSINSGRLNLIFTHTALWHRWICKFFFSSSFYFYLFFSSWRQQWAYRRVPLNSRQLITAFYFVPFFFFLIKSKLSESPC